MGRLQKMSEKKKAETSDKKDKKKKEDIEEEEDEDDDFEDVEEEDEEDEENEGNKTNNSKDKKITLYDLLDVSADASVEEIKKSYKKLALKIHPDKNRDDPEAKEKFQKIVEAYNILSDPEKKKIYDETGSYGDDFNEHAFEAAYAYYRTIYKKIEKEDIEDFEKKYRNSAMEEEDLINFYNENKGDMTTILECIPLSRNEDVSRFLEKYEELFVAEKIKILKAYNKTKNQIRLLAEDEEEGFKEVQNGLKDLASQILAKRGNAASFLDSLAEKYGGVANKKTKKQGNKSTETSTKAKGKK